MDRQIGIRLSNQDKELLIAVCEARGEGVSSFTRRIIRKELASLDFYPENVKKALGIRSVEGE